MPRRLRHHALRIALLAAGAIILTATPGSAQFREAWRLGGFVDWGRLDYATDLAGLPGVPSCCPHYGDGDGYSLALGLSWGYTLFSHVALEGRLSYALYKGTLEAEEYELVTAGRDTVTATFGHSIEVTQPALGLEALLSVETFSRLRVLGGGRAEWLPGGTVHQEEVILTPDNVRFENDRRQRLVYDADIPSETSLRFSLVGGVRYEIPLNRRGSVLLAPEAFYWQDFSDVIEDHRWRSRGFRVGLALQVVREKGPDEPSPLDPLPAEEAAKRREYEESRKSQGTE